MMEYKPERANVPSKKVLTGLRCVYGWLEQNKLLNAGIALSGIRESVIDQRVIDDLKSVYDLLDNPEKAMERIAEILTCGGRIYDEYSDFLKPIIGKLAI